MGNVILITGSTGFVGKVVVETLFRCRASFPFDKIVVLVRANQSKTARERFLDLAEKSPCFSLLPTSWVDDVRVIEGDMGEDDCGIADKDDAKYLYENTTHIIHCAASISFSAAADVLLRENVGSSLNLLALARRCPKLHHAVLTSTAYVTPWTTEPIHEQLVPLPLPAAELCERLRSGALSGDAALKLTGHPNLYTMTKCLAEHVVSDARANLPLTIVRPSIVSAAWQYPMPGWIDSFAAVTGVFTGVWMGVLRVVRGNLKTILDIVPVDNVAMSLVSTCLADVPQIESGSACTSYPLRIFHATTGMQHNIHAVQVYRIMTSKRLPAHPTMKPNLRYYGQNALWLPVADFVHQAVPVALGRAWAAVSGNAKLAKNLTKARRMQQSCNALFAHFGSHAYDFRSSRSPLDAAFEADEYLERVFRGAGRFLLKLDVSLQTVAMEKLYSDNESGSETAACASSGLGSDSGSSSSGGDDDSSSTDDGDSESGGSPASSIMDVAGVTNGDAAKTEDELLVELVESDSLLPEKNSGAVVTAVAIAL
ncbi:hypothetical protein PG993_002994 [Apiospora rasikravindrae]|uniref:Fatty acyl-CoA reductase n=1 Tax=Apiospora rasikravindrae TaxID=990691 RepID=A0ABR1TY99_9PEZI